MKISRFGKGKTLDSISERRQKLEDHDIGRLLDRICFTDVPLISFEKVQLYNTFVREIKKNRLRRFIDLNYVLLVLGLLLACSCVAVLVTGYDSNLVLFYMCCVVNLGLCFFSLSKSFNNLKQWLLRDSKEEKSE